MPAVDQSRDSKSVEVLRVWEVYDERLQFMSRRDALGASHVRERDKVLLQRVVVGVVWNGFLLGRVRSQAVPCRFCGVPDGDGHLFWECTFPPLVEIRENSEFHVLVRNG